MSGTKIVDFVKRQATALLVQNSTLTSTSTPSLPIEPPVEDESSKTADGEYSEAAEDYAIMIQSMMGAMYMGTGADGEITDQEYEQVKATFREATQGAIDDALFEETFEKVANSIDKEGFEYAISSIAANIPDREQRSAVLTMAIAAVLADGDADDTEQQFLLELATALEFSPEELQQLYADVTAQTN